MRQLNIGDRIYCEGFSRITGIDKIDKVTVKFAFAGNIKYRREYDADGNISIASRTAYDLNSYWIETPELKQRVIRQNLLAKTRKTFEDKIEQLSTEQLQQIIKILSE